MKFTLDECAMAAFSKGKLLSTQNFLPDKDTKMKELEPEEVIST